VVEGRPIPASHVPLATRELAEILLERLDAGTGTWTVELRAKNGRLEQVYRHETLGARALERFDEPPALPASG
jgi:hypothetical protein